MIEQSKSESCGGFLFSGSGAMFASPMHLLPDAINQGFVFVGSVLSEKKQTDRFPRAAPPTRLVFYEDVVAVLGAFFALISVVVIALANFALLNGIVTLIGCLMIADADDVKFRIQEKIMQNQDIADTVISIIEDDGTQNWAKKGRAHESMALFTFSLSLFTLVAGKRKN